MALICVFMGKSASGKDSILQRLMGDVDLGLKAIVPYTTRPKRETEQEGREYHFISDDVFHRMEREGKVIESRVYHTEFGDWYYLTADDGQVVVSGGGRYALIGTLDVYRSVKKFYEGSGVVVVPIYVEVDPGIRIIRAVERESSGSVAGYKEICRRFLRDEEDFSEENLLAAGIQKRFHNLSLDQCVREVKDYLLEQC